MANMMPLVMPTRGQEKRLKELAERAMEARRLTFAGAPMPARGVHAASPSELRSGIRFFRAHWNIAH